MKILIDLPEELINLLDSRAKSEESSRLRIIRLAIKSYFKEEKPSFSELKESFKEPYKGGGCDMPFCKSTSVGLFEINVQDNLEGSIKKKVNLCQFHLHKAKSEGEVKEL